MSQFVTPGRRLPSPASRLAPIGLKNQRHRTSFDLVDELEALPISLGHAELTCRWPSRRLANVFPSACIPCEWFRDTPLRFADVALLCIPLHAVDDDFQMQLTMPLMMVCRNQDRWQL